MLSGYIGKQERQDADRKLPRLMTEGLLLGGTGLGVLALIFEIAADAFSVAAYQTLLAIHGANGYHEIAILAFIVLSALLFLGIVPAYKAGAYLRPNAGGSGPLVEAIGPERLRWLSWVGTSLFFLDAILTIIISSISASDVTMLIYPELAPYRIPLAEAYAFFIMIVLVALGPKRAVPLFLLGGGAFTIFTIVALGLVGATAAGNPQWAFLTEGIVSRLEANGVVEHVIRAQQDISALGTVTFFQLFMRSMSSAMLGFSGYEVIPASGKHAARPKWKVINTALTLAAVFLIGTGVIQLFGAQRWNIPATEGYSTLLIEYEIAAVQTLGHGVDEEDIIITDQDRAAARAYYQSLPVGRAEEALRRETGVVGEDLADLTPEQYIEEVAYDLAFARTLNNALSGTFGDTFLLIAGVLLAIILLLAQGGGYVGGSAVAANAARLGRLPRFFSDDRIGIAVIWGFAAILIPIIREVVIVEAYYAFGFVSAFVITSTTVFLVRDDVLLSRGIDPKSTEARSLRFAGLRGMIASYFMAFVLITQKTNALGLIIVAGAAITLFQFYISNGNLRRAKALEKKNFPSGTKRFEFDAGLQRAHEEARQRGVAAALNALLEKGALAKFNVDTFRIIKMVSYLHNVNPALFTMDEHEHIEEPSLELEATYQAAFQSQRELLAEIEHYSHYGIFTFIRNYHANWINEEHHRDAITVKQAMLDLLFPLTPHEEMWAEYKEFTAQVLPEPVWQFSRERYRWAKDQWPNLSDRLTTVWTLQELNLLPDNIDVRTVIAVANGNKLKRVSLSTKTVEDDTLLEVSKEDFEIPEPDNGIIETGGEVRIPKDTNAKASPSDTPSDEKG
jgi:hypothetical protein